MGKYYLTFTLTNKQTHDTNLTCLDIVGYRPKFWLGSRLLWFSCFLHANLNSLQINHAGFFAHHSEFTHRRTSNSVLYYQQPNERRSINWDMKSEYNFQNAVFLFCTIEERWRHCITFLRFSSMRYFHLQIFWQEQCLFHRNWNFKDVRRHVYLHGHAFH